MQRVILSFLFIMVSSFAWGYSVSPMVSEISPIGSNAQVMMKVENTSAEPLQLEIQPYFLTFDDNQNEQLIDANDDLLVVPPTVTVPPGKFQSIIVRYIGDPSIKQSKTYRIVVEEAAIQQEGQSGVQMRYQFLTLLNVKPKNTKPQIENVRTYSEGGKWFLELTNKGTSYARLSRMLWQIGTKGSLVPVSYDEIRGHISGNLILPGQTRSFEFTPFDGIAPENMQVRIEGRD